MTGLYFLYLGDQLQYIGKSKDIDKRIDHHSRMGIMKFNRTEVIELELSVLAQKEKDFIKSMKPRFNTCFNPEKKESTEKLLLPDFFANQIAIRYYAIKNPERNYSLHYAIRQWRQDNHIDRDVLKVVINKVFEEQLKMLKK